ncbi:ABC transporter transmembrane domain-containing protein [Leucobacter rhizosphaerae]|uniref:ABC transporter transmembrane domain-containing protein n=1 Tax=Leucobacter rhizosphaerae TaxID=2932245 RepID=A0ABY4FYV8_9MICO|nr:ABC transporter ATP-binding protein [Leucobacter rhizosphaerae]UOQ61457.1 ABC transporter transmembrane domain-containing protein [Leucobacter rhizosphaerae]
MTDPIAGTTLPIASASEVRRTLARLLRRHRARTALVAVLFLGASGLGLVLPLCLGRIVDAVSTGAGTPTMAAWVGGVALGAISAALVALWGARMLAGLVQDVLAGLREDVFSAAMRLPVSTIDDGESADLLSRVTGDVDAVAEAGGSVVPTLLSAGFAVVVSLGALTALNPWLALAGVACLPFYVLGTRAFLRRSRVVFREMRAREASRSQAVMEAVSGRDTLTALNEQSHALRRVEDRAAASIRIQIDAVRVRNRLFRWINGGEAVGLIALLATGFVLVSSEAISVGMATAAALVFHRLFDPIGQLIFGLDDIQRATIGLARLVGVIELAPSRPPADVPAAGAPVGVTVDDVAFRYATTGRGLSGISLRVDHGTTVAFVGSSGSGKSTLARVIAGHHPPDTGTVRLDHDTAPYYISQELHQFRGGIAENLRLAAPGASDRDLAEVLRAVGADWALAGDAADPAADLTAASSPEHSLDEGRIQQLAIARALLADAPVVILDEATADVGLQHRDAVERAIEVLRRDRTTILIAHRLQSVSNADRIFVLQGGEIVQQGTHDGLRARAGAYREFWDAHSASAPHPPDPALSPGADPDPDPRHEPHSDHSPEPHSDRVSGPCPDPETETP